MGWTGWGRGTRAWPAGAVLALAMAGGACASGDDGWASEPGDRGTTGTSDATGGSTAPATPVGWERVDDLLAAPLGEYHKVMIVGEGGSLVPVSDEWVTYDLPNGLVDRRLATRVDPQTGDPTPATGRDDPMLWFVHTPDAVYMHAPSLEQQCGATWADMGIAGGAPRLEPLDVLRAAERPAQPAHTDAAGSTYVIPVPGATGVDTSSSFFARNPDLVEELARHEATAEVLLPRDGGPVRMDVDLSEAFATIGQPGAGATARWELTAPLATVEITPPADAVREEECPAASG